jgi:hypothetical protein
MIVVCSAVLSRVDFKALVYTRVLHATALFVCPGCVAVYNVLYTVYIMGDTVYNVLYTVYIMGDTVSDISVGDLDILRDVGADMNSWIGNLRTALKCKSHQEVTIEKLTKPGIMKDILAKMLFEGYQTVYSHRDKFESSRVCFEKLKSE